MEIVENGASVSYDVKAEEGVMPAGSTLKIELAADNTTSYTNAITTLKDIINKDKMKVLEIELLKLDGEATQPDGVVEITSKIPEGFDPERLVVYYVDNHGNKEDIKVTINKADNTFTMGLRHFSTYVVAEKIETVATVPTIPNKGDTTYLWVSAMMLGIACVIMGTKKYTRYFT